MKLNIKKLDGSNKQIKCDSFSIVTYGKDKTIKELYSGGEIEKVTVVSTSVKGNMSLHDCKIKYMLLIDILESNDEVHEWMIIDINNSSVDFIQKVNENIKNYIIRVLETNC